MTCEVKNKIDENWFRLKFREIYQRNIILSFAEIHQGLHLGILEHLLVERLEKKNRFFFYVMEVMLMW